LRSGGAAGGSGGDEARYAALLALWTDGPRDGDDREPWRGRRHGVLCRASLRQPADELGGAWRGDGGWSRCRGEEACAFSLRGGRRALLSGERARAPRGGGRRGRSRRVERREQRNDEGDHHQEVS